MITLLDVEEVFHKIYCSLIIKTLNKLGIEWYYLDKTHLHKTKASIIFKNERMKSHPED